MIAILLLSVLLTQIHSFKSPYLITKRKQLNGKQLIRRQLNMFDCSLIAGAFAGSIGVGIAYPFDAIKTKSQTYASSSNSSISGQ